MSALSPPDLWNSGQEIQPDDPCDRYFKSRGISLDRFPDCLRLVSELPSWRKDVDLAGTAIWIDEGSFPTLLARIDSPSGELITLHRSYLTFDGRKAPVESPKKLMKAPSPGATKGGAIKLCPAGSELALAEGLETALAFHLLTTIPVWATVTAIGMENVVLPRQVETVYICVDVDMSCRGELAADVLAKRLIEEGRTVYKATPPGCIPEGAKGLDWLDYLNRLQNEYTTKPHGRLAVRSDERAASIGRSS